MNTAPTTATIDAIQSTGRIIPGPQSVYCTPAGNAVATIFDTPTGTVIQWNPLAQGDYSCILTLAMGRETFIKDGGRVLGGPEAVKGWHKASNLVLSQIKKAVN